MTNKSKPNYHRETLLHKQGFDIIAGVDEVGRGPLAGPVTAAAVVINRSNMPDGLDDSKRLSTKNREALFSQIMESSLVGIAHASVEEIDKINILQASLLAMKRAFSMLKSQPDYALIDGNTIPDSLAFPATAIVKGDRKSVSIAAASIVAKISRDRIMTELSRLNPGYGWENNSGYPTKEHLIALRDIGVTPHHRRSFRPVHNILYKKYSALNK